MGPTKGQAMEPNVGTGGPSVVIKGELTAKEDITFDGQIEGKIELGHNVLTIGPNGRVKAHVIAKTVIVLGSVEGDITATEKIALREMASVHGDLVTPRLGIAEGASFRGTIDMSASRTPAKGTGTGKPPAGATPR